MISRNSRLSAHKYIDGLTVRGRYHFAFREAQSVLGVSANAATLALSRLAKQELIASPARGFYVIVPPEYRPLGCLPADQFIPARMKWLDLAYYAGLLSAAEYHGAAHQRPQAFQVFLAKNRRPIQCGTVRIAFHARARITGVPVQRFNTPRGTVRVSSPEATALDLIGYQRQAGGLDQVAMVLRELAERLTPAALAAAAKTAPVAWAQRLGYLLEHLGFAEKTSALEAYVRERSTQSTALLPGAPHGRSGYDTGWKLHVNAEVEAEP